jgi:hypothetical protein
MFNLFLQKYIEEANNTKDSNLLLDLARKIKLEQGFHEAIPFFTKVASEKQDLNILQEATININNDADKFNILKLGIDWTFKPENDYTKWRYYDELSILAYYQNNKKIANKAYSILIKYSLYPDEHKNRILNNGKFLNANDNLNYKLLCNEIKNIKESILDIPKINSIPNIIHFIYIKGYDFQLHHFLTIISSYKQMNFNRMHIYTNEEPINNNWWNYLKQIPSVYIYIISIPTFINYHFVEFKQHQADIIRLVVLKEFGGVYHDLDMLTLKNYTEIIQNTTEISLVKECETRLSNSIIITPENNLFINEWLICYENSYGEEGDWWAGLSVEMPYKLSKKYKINILDTSTFLPFDYFHTDFFTKQSSNIDFTNTFGIHLWDTEQQKRNILPKNETEFQQSNSLFYSMFGHYLNNINLNKNTIYPFFVFIDNNNCNVRNYYIKYIQTNTNSNNYLFIFDDEDKFKNSEENPTSFLFEQLIIKYKLISSFVNTNRQSIIILGSSPMYIGQYLIYDFFNKNLISKEDFDRLSYSYNILFNEYYQFMNNKILNIKVTDNIIPNETILKQITDKINNTIYKLI